MASANQPRHFRIFLASPSDVAAERSLVMKVVDDLPYAPSFRGRITLEIVAWEKKGAPPLEAGIPPQEAIRQGLPQPHDCDIVVVIFWSRMGTPTPVNGIEYKSGTYYEYEDAMQAYARGGSPRILVYRRTEKVEVDLDDPDLASKREQRRLVTEFFEQFNDPKTKVAIGGYNTYQKPEEFREQFDGHIRNLISRLLETSSKPSAQDHQSVEQPKVWQGSPFPGLRAFKAEDAPIYFGRGRETDALTRRVQEQNFVAVVGASGSGKSSLVGAGLIPRLRNTVGEGRLLEVIFTPDEHGVGNPFGPLAAALRDLPGLHERHLAPKLQENPDLLPEIIGRTLEHMPDRAWVLLFIDQFEELFTTVQADFRQSFIEMLVITVRHERIRTAVTLRSDFYGHAIAYSELAELLEAGTFPLSAPGIGALHEMITRPAGRSGLDFEGDLADQILEDTGPEPGAVALLAYALDELYRVCGSTGVLTNVAYNSLGGVQGAIGRRSEVIYADLDTEAQRSMPALFRELVSVEINGTVTRKRASLSGTRLGDPAMRFADAFTEARLLIRGRGEDNDPYIEVAHEALLRNWKPLTNWIENAKESLLLLKQVREAAYQWNNAGRPSYYLWSHERLEPVTTMQQSLSVEFDEVVEAFIRPETERLLFELLNDTNPLHRQLTTIDRFSEIGNSTLPILREIVSSNISIQVRIAAIGAITKVRGHIDDKAIIVLLNALQSEEVVVRNDAIIAFGKLRDFRAVQFLCFMAALNPRPNVRTSAVGALGELRVKDAIPVLLSTLNDEAITVRYAAVNALGLLGDKQAIPYLVDTVMHNKGHDLFLIEHVVTALKKIGGRQSRLAIQTVREYRYLDFPYNTSRFTRHQIG